MANKDVFKGISIHSAQYKNAVLLRKKGVKVNISSENLPLSIFIPFQLTFFASHVCPDYWFGKHGR